MGMQDAPFALHVKRGSIGFIKFSLRKRFVMLY